MDSKMQCRTKVRRRRSSHSPGFAEALRGVPRVAIATTSYPERVLKAIKTLSGYNIYLSTYPGYARQASRTLGFEDNAFGVESKIQQKTLPRNWNLFLNDFRYTDSYV